MANDEEPVEKVLMASLWVAVTSKDSANRNLATLVAPAESLPDEGTFVRGSISAFVEGSINAFVKGSINVFVRESISAEWSESVARNSVTFAGPRAGYSKNGDRYTQQQDSSVERRHAACCRGADGRGYPLQGSTPQQKQRRRRSQQQQPRGSGGTFPAEYAAQAATTSYLHHLGHAG